MLKLNTLEDVIRDTIRSREEIKANIDNLLALPSPTKYASQVSESKESLKQTQAALQSQRRSIQAGPYLPFALL